MRSRSQELQSTHYFFGCGGKFFRSFWTALVMFFCFSGLAFGSRSSSQLPAIRAVSARDRKCSRLAGRHKQWKSSAPRWTIPFHRRTTRVPSHCHSPNHCYTTCTVSPCDGRLIADVHVCCVESVFVSPLLASSVSIAAVTCFAVKSSG